jgi:hypothetical protein
VRYDVKHASSLIKCGGEARVGDVTAFDNHPDPDTLNQVRLDVNPIGTGLYPDRLTLTSAHDLRIIDVEVSARKLGQSFALNFDVHALQTATQNIPVVNTSDAAMTVTAVVRAA